MNTLLRTALIFAVVGIFGCNDSDKEDKNNTYSFYNDSSRSVIVYYSYKYTPYVTPLARPLNPGESFSLTVDESSSIYWDYDPESRVTAHQVSPNYVVFTDKANSSSSGNTGSTKPTPSGTTPAVF